MFATIRPGLTEPKGHFRSVFAVFGKKYGIARQSPTRDTCFVVKGNSGSLRQAQGPSQITSYFFTCLWYSCKLQTSNLPKSYLSMRPSTVEVRAAMGDAEHGAGLDALVVEHRRGAAGGVQFVSEVHELANERDCLLLVFVLERDEDVALARDLVARCQMALEVGKAAVAIEAHDFAGRVVHFVYNLLARLMKICKHIFA